jgi:dolichol kinase
MNDVVLVAFWIGLAATAFTVCVAARRAGVAVTHLRDIIHVGAGLWPLGWIFWQGRVAPVSLAIAGTVATFAVPALAGRASALAAHVQQSISDTDERWTGVQLYGAAFSAATILAFTTHPFAPAAALLALALGDGFGGAIGRRFGRHFYATPSGKRKSMEGSVAVALFSMAAIALAAARFGVALPMGAIAGAAVIAALAEALAPAGTDNVLLPAAVWLFLVLQGGAS